MTVLMSITIITITAGLSGYYYLRSQNYLELVQEYESSYPNLLQKYTDLLENYTSLIDLLENYNNLIKNYNDVFQNHTELWEEYESVTVLFKLCIDYGNGTAVWYNGSRIPINTNLLNATQRVADVQYTYWPALEASFIDAINGVRNSPAYYWMWLYQDANTTTWTYGPAGADVFIVKSGQVFMWRYEIPTY